MFLDSIILCLSSLWYGVLHTNGLEVAWLQPFVRQAFPRWYPFDARDGATCRRQGSEEAIGCPADGGADGASARGARCDSQVVCPAVGGAG